MSEKKNKTSVRQNVFFSGIGLRVEESVPGMEVLMLGIYSVDNNTNFSLFVWRIRIFSLRSWSVGYESTLAEHIDVFSNE